MKNYVTNIYIYNDIVWCDVENILHENNISQDNKFNEFQTYVSCKINDDVEKKFIKTRLTCMQYYLLSSMSIKFMMWEHFMSVLPVK